MIELSKLRLHKSQKFPAFIALISLLGLMASIALSSEKTHLLKNPQAELFCDLNPIYSCKSVILSAQASIFGFSNELIGIAFFGGVLALAIGLLAGAKYKAWLHKLVWLGLLGSMMMVVWFFYQSVYVIGALCIYCSSVWFVTWLLFIRYSHWLLVQKLIKTPKKLAPVFNYFIKYPITIWLIGVLLFICLALNHFWYYYGSKF